MPFLLYFSVLGGASLNIKLQLYRRGLNVARERFRLPDKHAVVADGCDWPIQ